MTRDPFQNNQIPRALWDTVARNTIEQGLWDAPELDRLLNNQPQLGTCCPVFDQNTFAAKYDQVLNNAHRASFYLNREWRTRNNSPAGRYGTPPGSPTNLYQLQKTPSWMIRASENWVISDRLLHRFAFGYNRFENDNRSVFFNAGWPSRIGLTNQPDTTFPRFAFGGTAILGAAGNFGSISRGLSYEGSTIVQDDLTFITGRHSIKTGFEGRFYFVDNENADGTATYNFNSAQTNLPGSDTADRSCLRELPAGRGADVEPAGAGGQHRLLPAQLRLLRPGRFQGHAEADAQPGRALGRSCRACTRRTATSPTST